LWAIVTDHVKCGQDVWEIIIRRREKNMLNQVYSFSLSQAFLVFLITGVVIAPLWFLGTISRGGFLRGVFYCLTFVAGLIGFSVGNSGLINYTNTAKWTQMRALETSGVVECGGQLYTVIEVIDRSRFKAVKKPGGVVRTLWAEDCRAPEGKGERP
jgi:hypothetical protein